MSLYWPIGGVILASLFSLVFSTLTYCLRDYSRPRLAEYLGRRDTDHWFEFLTEHNNDLVFLTAIARQFCNIAMWLFTFALFEQITPSRWLCYLFTVAVAGAIAIFCSIALPHAAAKYASAEVVGFGAPLLYLTRTIFLPVTQLMHGTERLVRRALGANEAVPETEIEEDILSAIEEGEKEGVVDEQEREIIESVIEFGDTTVEQIMTPRQEMLAIPISATLDDLKKLLQSSGHSRVPVYEESLDHVIGILYARDMIRQLGLPVEQFDLRDVMRQPMFVPETKLLRDLLREFRLQKVHIAIVLDEYGGTAGLVTIEDILEELVGEIADEHDRAEPAMLKRIDDRTMEVDARLEIEELNRAMGLGLPEDAGYSTLGGFLTTALSRIPEKGAVYEFNGARYTVLASEPQRINSVKVEVLTPAAAGV